MDARPVYRVVVVGGGVAGATCAAEVAGLASPDLARRVEVTLVSYSAVVRVATAGALRCEVEVSDEPAEVWARAAGVTVLHDRAIALTARAVVLEKRGALAFDACCIATGARPSVPSWLDGADPSLANRIFTVRDAQSVHRMRAALASCRHVVVVGNGGVAMELAYEVTGCDVTWVIKDNYVGNSFFDERAGGTLLRFLKPGSGRNGKLDRFVSSLVNGPGEPGEIPAVYGSGAGPHWLGVRQKPILLPASEVEQTAGSIPDTRPGASAFKIVRNCRVLSVKHGLGSSGWPVCVELANGSEVHCDAVLCAVGVQPNVEWLGPSSLLEFQSDSDAEGTFTDVDVRGGIRVEAGTMRSCSRTDVFAAGDCATIVRDAEMSAKAGNNWFQMRLWTQAATAGRMAARGILQSVDPSVGVWDDMGWELFAHATQFFGQKVILLGRYSAQGLPEGYNIVEGGDESHFTRVVLLDGKARGALLIGNADLAETYENLILDGLDLSHIPPSELVDPSIDLEDYFD